MYVLPQVVTDQESSQATELHATTRMDVKSSNIARMAKNSDTLKFRVATLKCFIWPFASCIVGFVVEATMFI